MAKDIEDRINAVVEEAKDALAPLYDLANGALSLAEDLAKAEAEVDRLENRVSELEAAADE